MTEEVSGTIRLSVTVAMLGTVVMLAVNTLIFSLSIMDYYRDGYVDAVNQSGKSVVTGLQNMDSIESTNIYKLLRTDSGISKITVILTDGTRLTFDVTSDDCDINWFKRNAQRSFKVTVESRSGYNITCTEVE